MNFSFPTLILIVQSDTDTHTAFRHDGIGALAPKFKRHGHEDERSCPSTAMIKNVWSYTSSLQYVFLA